MSLNHDLIRNRCRELTDSLRKYCEGVVGTL